MSLASGHDHRVGLSERAEQVFEKASNSFLVLLTCAWVFAIVSSRLTGDKVNPVTPVTAAVVSSLSDPRSPTAAYVTDAVTSAVATVSARDAGESGKLLAEIRDASEHPGIIKAMLAASGTIKRASEFSVITPRTAADVRGGKLGLYYIGNWPGSRVTRRRRVSYTPPGGFIEVTRENAGTRLSEHFRLRDFLTHDQQNVWPKYVHVSLDLVDKLELVLTDLQQHGINPSGVHVMSGFRTPQYNRHGGDPSGRADLSRHMYGDAADIYIDDDGNGSMDDLDHDGKVTVKDAGVILAAVNRVERAHPSLIGGAGVYAATSTHGPFIHIDTRGYPARW